MKWAVAIVAFVAALAVVQGANPQLSETFESKANVWYTVGDDMAHGFGYWAVDQVDGMIAEKWYFDEKHQTENVEYVARYDLGVEYSIATHDYYGTIVKNCSANTIKGAMPSQWAWLYHAEDQGQQTNVGPAKQSCHLYTYSTAGMELAVCLDDSTQLPVYYSRDFRAGKLEVQFTFYLQDEAADSWFEIDTICAKFNHLISPPKFDSSPVITYDLLKYNAPQALAQALAKAREICTCGCPYIWGGNGPCCGGGNSGYDCSGMIVRAYSIGGIGIARTSQQQQQGGRGCSGGIAPGDLLFWGWPAHHVTMYAGNNQMYECPRSGLNCMIAPLRNYDGGCKRYF